MRFKKKLSLWLVLAMLLSLLSACGTEPPGPTRPENTPTPPETEEYTLPTEDGCNQLTLYWSSPSADYDKCDVLSLIHI